MNYHNITKCDMNNGEGIRVVLWVSGCSHHCPECQNPQTWDKNSGIFFNIASLKEILAELQKDYVSGITFSGGDPLYPANRRTILFIIKNIKEFYPNKTIWLYTGYKYEQLIYEGDFITCQILKNCDVIVDGKYKKDLRDINLKWRGSSNQRVIDVRKSLDKGEVVLYCD